MPALFKFLKINQKVLLSPIPSVKKAFVTLSQSVGVLHALFSQMFQIKIVQCLLIPALQDSVTGLQLMAVLHANSKLENLFPMLPLSLHLDAEKDFAIYKALILVLPAT